VQEHYEFTYYIPPDVTVNDDGTIDNDDWRDKVYEFKSGDRFLMSFTGMGMPPLEYIEQQGPNQHGKTMLGYRLQPRLIQLVHRRHAASCGGREGYWTARHDLLNRIRPNRQNANTFGMGRLRKRLPGGLLRDIDVLIDRGPAFAARDLDAWDEWAFTETIRFYAPDPTFYDPELQEVTWSTETDGDLAVEEDIIFYSAAYPDHWVLPFVFGSSVIDDSTTLEYTAGTGQSEPTWHSFPVIEITGPLVQPRIENTTTEETIELGYTISGGEVVTIDLSYGNKTVTNAAGTNLIGTVTPESNLATFHLGVDPEAPDAVNTINVTGSGGISGTTQITMKWRWRFIGI